MSCSLNSLKKVIYGTMYESVMGVIKGYTRSLDYSSYVVEGHAASWHQW